MPSLRNLDLNLIKVFDAIYSTRSVSGAARRMGVSQPSVSRGLGRLREHFDDPLFERAGNGVAPTAKAESILDSVTSALSLIEGAIDETPAFDPATSRRHFRILLPDFVEATVMPDLINSLPEGARLTFEAVTFADTDVRVALMQGGLDIAVMPFLSDEPDLSYREVMRDHYVIIARKGHPHLAEGFSWPLLDRLRFVALPERVSRMGRLDEVLKTRDLKRTVTYMTQKLSSLPLLVASTDLVSFMGSRYAQSLKDSHGLDVFEAPGLSAIEQRIYLAHGAGADSDPAIGWLRGRILAAYAAEGAGEDAATAR